MGLGIAGSGEEMVCLTSIGGSKRDGEVAKAGHARGLTKVMKLGQLIWTSHLDFDADLLLCHPGCGSFHPPRVSLARLTSTLVLIPCFGSRSL